MNLVLSLNNTNLFKKHKLVLDKIFKNLSYFDKINFV